MTNPFWCGPNPCSWVCRPTEVPTIECEPVSTDFCVNDLTQYWIYVPPTLNSDCPDCDEWTGYFLLSIQEGVTPLTWRSPQSDSTSCGKAESDPYWEMTTVDGITYFLTAKGIGLTWETTSPWACGSWNTFEGGTVPDSGDVIGTIELYLSGNNVYARATLTGTEGADWGDYVGSGLTTDCTALSGSLGINNFVSENCSTDYDCYIDYRSVLLPFECSLCTNPLPANVNVTVHNVANDTCNDCAIQLNVTKLAAFDDNTSCQYETLYKNLGCINGWVSARAYYWIDSQPAGIIAHYLIEGVAEWRETLSTGTDPIDCSVYPQNMTLYEVLAPANTCNFTNSYVSVADVPVTLADPGVRATECSICIDPVNVPNLNVFVGQIKNGKCHTCDAVNGFWAEYVYQGDCTWSHNYGAIGCVGGAPCLDVEGRITTTPCDVGCEIHNQYGPQGDENWVLESGNWADNGSGWMLGGWPDELLAVCRKDTLTKNQYISGQVKPDSGVYASNCYVYALYRDETRYMGVKIARPGGSSCYTFSIVSNDGTGEVVHATQQWHGDWYDATANTVGFAFILQYREDGILQFDTSRLVQDPQNWWHNIGTRMEYAIPDTGGRRHAIRCDGGNDLWYGALDGMFFGDMKSSRFPDCPDRDVCYLYYDVFGGDPACIFDVITGNYAFVATGGLGTPYGHIVVDPGSEIRYLTRSEPEEKNWRMMVEFHSSGIANDQLCKLHVAADSTLRGAWGSIYRSGGNTIFEVGQGDTVLASRFEIGYPAVTHFYVCTTPSMISVGTTTHLGSNTVLLSANASVGGGEYSGLSVSGLYALWIETIGGYIAKTASDDWDYCDPCEQGTLPGPGDECSVCTGTPPPVMNVTKTGISNKDCDNCISLNGTDQLTHIGGCQWQKNHGPLGCINDGEDVIETLTYWENGPDAGYANLSISGIGEWDGGISSMPFPCDYDPQYQPLPFAWSYNDRFCDPVGSEVTLSPGT